MTHRPLLRWRRKRLGWPWAALALTLSLAACSDDTSSKDQGVDLRAVDARSDAPRPDGPRADGPRPDSAQADSAQPDGPTPDGARRDALVADLSSRDFGPQDFCAAFCDYRFRCASFSKTLCLSQCATTQQLLLQKYSPTYTTTLAACYATLSCQSSGDKCTSAALLAADPNCVTNATVTACTAAYQGCALGGSDKCLSFCGLLPSGQTALAACLSKACADLDACVVPLISTK